MIISIVNGPNLNLVGRREPGIYGTKSMEAYIDELKSQYLGHTIHYYQSNHEGDLIDYLQEVGFLHDGIILNAGGYTHTSIALADTVRAIKTPVIEVHITDIFSRESFRRHSYLSAPCVMTIMGKGLYGYKEAIDFFAGSQK